MRTATLTCDVCGSSEQMDNYRDLGIAIVRRGAQQLGPDVDICEPCLKAIECEGFVNVIKAGCISRRLVKT